jgi:hypothetical protein
VLISAGIVMIAAGTVLAVLAFTWFTAPSDSGPSQSGPAATATVVPTTPALTATASPTRSPTPSRTASPTPASTPSPTRPMAAGTFLIRNQASGRCVDLPFNGPAKAGAVLFQWDCQPGDPENQVTEKVKDGKDFLLRNVKSDLCLALSDTGPAVRLGKCGNQWFRSRARPGGLQLIQTKSNLCLDLIADDPEGETGNGRNLVLSPCSSAVTQIWTFE